METADVREYKKLIHFILIRVTAVLPTRLIRNGKLVDAWGEDLLEEWLESKLINHAKEEK